MAAAWIYILKCSDGSYYTGSTSHLEYRLQQHMLGASNAYTASRLPVELVYAVECQNIEEAYKFERQIKGWSRKKKEALIIGDWEELMILAKPISRIEETYGEVKELFKSTRYPMSETRFNPRKVVVVGAGAVGSTFAYALAQSGLADEITILDRNHDLAQGQVLDLAHGLAYYPSVDISVGTSEDYRDAHVIVVTAGAAQREGQTRLELLKQNAAIIESIVDDIVAQQSRAVILLVTNPVDVLTHLAHKRSGWERGRVIGSGTVLDSARFRYLLSQHCGVDVHNVHAYILGEHGDSELAAWSMTHIGGVSIEDYCEQCGGCAGWDTVKNDIEEAVRRSAYHIIEYKGATNYAVGMAMVRIVGAILRDDRSVLTVSVPMMGEYGLSDVSLGVPSIVASNGVVGVLEAKLTAKELKALRESAQVLKDALKTLAGEK